MTHRKLENNLCLCADEVVIMGNTSVHVRISNNSSANIVAVELRGSGSQSFNNSNVPKFENVSIDSKKSFETTLTTNFFSSVSTINLKFLYDSDDVDIIEIYNGFQEFRVLKKSHRVKFGRHKYNLYEIIVKNTRCQELVQEATELMVSKQFDSAEQKLLQAFSVNDAKMLKVVEEKSMDLTRLKAKYVAELNQEGNLYVGEKRMVEALVKFEDAVSLSEDQEERNTMVLKKADVLNEMGKGVLRDAWTYEKFCEDEVGSKFQEAEELFKEALRLVEHHLEYQYNLKRVRIKMDLDRNRFAARRMEEEAQVLLDRAGCSKLSSDYELVREKYEEIYKVYLMIEENINEGLRNSDRNFEVFAEINERALRVTAATLQQLKM